MLRSILIAHAGRMERYQESFARKGEIDARISASVANELASARRLLSQLEP